MPGHGDYTLRQVEKDRHYDAAYRTWVATLSPEQRRGLAGQGLDRPELDRVAKKANLTADIGEMNLGESEAEETQGDEDAPTFSSQTSVRVFLSLILEGDDARLNAKCIAIATGLSDFIRTDTTYVTEAEIAREHKLTRAAVSKRVRALAKALHLEPTGIMRPEKVNRTYRAARIRSLQLTHTKPASPCPNSSKSSIARRFPRPTPLTVRV